MSTKASSSSSGSLSSNEELSEEGGSVLSDLLSDDSMIDDDESWGREEWLALVGDQAKIDELVAWMAQKCPGNVLLHTCSLEDDLRDLMGQKHFAQMYERHEKQLWEELKKDKPELYRIFDAKRAEYEEEWDDIASTGILGDFFVEYREPWMLVGNEEVRNAVKGLSKQDDVYYIARIHRRIFMSDVNLTSFTSRVLKQASPDPFWVLDDLKNTLAYHNRRHEYKAGGYATLGFNMGCARDVLKHLVATQHTRG
jgi:hypothetical protein